MRIAFNPSTVAALTSPPNNKDITFDLKGHNIFARGVEFKGTDTNTWRPVVDNLTSDSTTSSLSAKQGKVLKALIDGKSNSGHTHDDRYLKLTGGTLTGNLAGTSATFSGRFYGNGDDEGIIIKPASNGYAALTLGTHDGERSVFYFTKGNPFWRYNNGTYNLDIKHPKKAGTIALTSDIPTKGSWNYDDRYLRLSGGTMNSDALIRFADSGSWDTDKGPQGARGGFYWTGQSDYAKLYAEETAGDNLDLVIKFGDDNSNGLSIRNKSNVQTSYISAGGVITAGTFKGNLDWSYITNKPATATRWPSWAEVTGKPSSFTPSTHTHGLSNSVFFLNMPSISGNAKWKEVFGYPVNYNLLLSVRINSPAPEWCVGNYGSGILYGGSDTKGFMSSAYDKPLIMWAGGNGSSDDSVPKWYIGIRGTHKSIYNLTTIASEANAAYNLRHSHANKSVLDGITSGLVSNWNTAYTFVHTITGTDTDKVINKWDEIVNFLAGITEDNKLNTLLNSKLSIYELADKTNVGTIKNNGIYYSTTDASSGTFTNSPFNTGFALINMTSCDGGDDLRRSRLAFNAYGEIKVSDDRDWANTAETWYNVLTSKNSGISGSTIKLNGTSITVYSSGTADGRYVKKSGDTMTGVLTIDTTNFGTLTIKRNDDTNGASIQFRGKSSVYGYIGLNNSTKDKQFLRWNSDTSKFYTILDTSSTYTSSGKGVINGTTITQVDNATNATNSTNARKLVNWYSARPTSLNAQFGDGSLRIFHATSSTTEGKPAEDSHILHLAWDNTGGWDAQLAVHTRSGKVSTRAQNGGTWQPWKTLAFTTDIPSSLKNPHPLTLKANGTTLAIYDGSSTKEANFTYANVGAASASHTHTWTSITDKIVAGNEFNIVNAGFKEDLWFNYLPINDSNKTATISGYHFGNGAKGYTAVKASGFIKNGSNDSYVLLGGGSHKTESSLRVAYASSAGSATSATKVIVNQHTTNDTNYPLVWSNQANTSNVTENQLYKSWADLYYNPKNKRLTVGGSVVTSSFIKSGGTSQQLLRADGGIAAFNWSGQSGQPTWLWGGNNFNSYYVYNPSNFRVAYAASAGNAETLGGEHASSFVRAGHYESQDLNKLDTYSFIRSVGSNNKDTSPNGNTGWYNVIQAVHRNGVDDGPNYIGQIALGMTTNINGMFYRTKYNGSWYAWNEVVTTNTGLLRYSRNNVNISSPNCSPIPPSLLEWTVGYPRLYDPEFNEGDNNVQVYNNASNEVVTVTRIHDTNVGNSSSYIMKVVSAAGAFPNYGGWNVATQTELGKVYTCLFRASIPSGVEIEWNSNSIGTGGQMSWLTNNMGTGKWAWYAVQVYCGSGGSTTFFFSAKSPCTWYLSYVNVIENNRASYAGLRSVYSDYLKANASIVFGRNELQYFNQYTGVTSGATNNANPKTNWYHILRMNHANNNGYFVDLAIPFNDNRIQFRRITNGSDNGWRRVITEEPNHDVILREASTDGNVGIGINNPAYKLDVNGQMRAEGFHHQTVNSDNYMLLAGGGYKSFGGDGSNPIFLGYLNLDHGNDGTISSSFSCLGYSVPFTYTRGGNYCKIYIPDTTHQVFYIKAATASVNYSGGGMDTWTDVNRGSGAWWLHCYAYGTNEIRVKGFCQSDKNNDSWWGGNPLWSSNDGANKITVCIFGYVEFI